MKHPPEYPVVLHKTVLFNEEEMSFTFRTKLCFVPVPGLTLMFGAILEEIEEATWDGNESEFHVVVNTCLLEQDTDDLDPDDMVTTQDVIGWMTELGWEQDTNPISASEALAEDLQALDEEEGLDARS